MKSEEKFSLSYLPLMIRLKCLEEASLPIFLGSTLHGAVGWALRSHRNAYKYIYENGRLDEGTQVTVNPYTIEPPKHHNIYQRGEELRFQINLIGNGTYYTEELIRALSETRIFGLGAERKKFELQEILHGQSLVSVWRSNKVNYDGIDSVKLNNESQKNTKYCSLHLLTPLRIRRGGKLVTEVDFATIVRNITRRLGELTQRYGGSLNLDEAERINELAKEIQITSGQLQICQMERYSNRRGIKMDFSGLLGALIFQGDMEPFIPWLNAARVLHIGRNTTFGCGQLEIVCW